MHTRMRACCFVGLHTVALSNCCIVLRNIFMFVHVCLFVDKCYTCKQETNHMQTSVRIYHTCSKKSDSVISRSPASLRNT
jgi:hypothetical protein